MEEAYENIAKFEEEVRVLQTELSTEKAELEVSILRKNTVPDNLVFQSRFYKNLQKQAADSQMILFNENLLVDSLWTEREKCHQNYISLLEKFNSFDEENNTTCKETIYRTEAQILANKREIEKIKCEVDRQKHQKNFSFVHQEVQLLLESLQLEYSYLCKEAQRLRALHSDSEAHSPLLKNVTSTTLKEDLLEAYQKKNTSALQSIIHSIITFKKSVEEESENEQKLMKDMQKIIQAYEALGQQSNRLSSKLAGNEKRNKDLLDKENYFLYFVVYWFHYFIKIAFELS
ncbi:uncharacterized protein LOC135119352 [Zophobas morio]|uniref:uncharacterized protein LOC135119352 n=1 Tax=Zophobas morio TaxID=2755281 RepID=UPI003083602A